MIAPILAIALVLNPSVRADTIRTTICRPGYAASIRPPASYTARIKRRLLPPGARMGEYVLDHHVSLALGGAPRDPRNLVLQPLAEARRKDRLEASLHRAVCQGRVSLDDARVRISEWRP